MDRAGLSVFHLRGLWFSGLRLEESLQLSWDRDDKPRIDLTGKYPMLRMIAEMEKGHKDRLLPLAPEFAEMLLATPEAERTGYVFRPTPKVNSGSNRLAGLQTGRTIAQIGEAAGVLVHTDPTTGKVKYASAHDLRRGFGTRWSTRVMPTVLKELMRHDSIETTMKFYVGANAEATADALYAAISQTDAEQPKIDDSGNISGNINDFPLPNPLAEQ